MKCISLTCPPNRILLSLDKARPRFFSFPPAAIASLPLSLSLETYFQDEHNAIQSLQDLQSFRFVQDPVVPAGRAIVEKSAARAALGVEERPDGVELENNLFEPKLVGCDD